MTDEKLQTAIGLSAVSLTRHIVETEGLSLEAAYRKLMTTELYKLLQDSDSRLLYEEDAYLFDAYDIENRNGVDALYAFVQA